MCCVFALDVCGFASNRQRRGGLDSKKDKKSGSICELRVEGRAVGCTRIMGVLVGPSLWPVVSFLLFRGLDRFHRATKHDMFGGSKSG